MYGQPNIVGKFIAVEEINAAGGIMIDGKKVKIDLISEDDQAKPDQGVTIFRKLEGKDQALAITGTIYSRVSETCGACSRRSSTTRATPGCRCHPCPSCR